MQEASMQSPITTNEPKLASAVELFQQFGRLRRRYMFWKLVDTIGQTMVWLILLTGLAVVVDGLAPLPWQFRLVLVGLVAAAFLYGSFRTACVIFQPPSYSSLARSIQTDQKDLQSHLVAAGMLLEQSEPTSFSEDSKIQALSYAAKVLRPWTWQRSIKRSLPLRRLLLGIALLMAFSSLNVLPSWKLLNHRWLGVFGSSAASDHLLVFIDPPEYAYQGQSMELRVKSVVPIDMQSLSLSIDGEYQSMDKSEQALDYTIFKIQRIQSDLVVQARLQSGATSKSIRVRMRDHAKIIGHTFHVIPPDYVGQLAYDSDKSSIVVTQGSQVDLKLAFNEPIENVRIKARSSDMDKFLLSKGLGPQSVVVELDELTKLSSNVLEQSLSIELMPLAVDSDQQELAFEYPLQLQVQTDAPPEVTELSLVDMRETESTLPLRKSQVKARVTDDFGLRRVTMEFQGIATKSETLDESLHGSKIVLQSDGVQNLSKSLQLREEVDLTELTSQWPACDAIDVCFHVLDSAGHAVVSDTLRIQLYQEESEHLRMVQQTNDVLQMQKQLQEQTNQTMNIATVPDRLLEDLAKEQGKILEKWGQSLADDPSQNAPLKRLSNSIKQMMQSSEQGLARGQVAESNAIQKAIIDQLNDFARTAQSKENRSSQENKETEEASQDRIELWAQRQADIVQRIRELVNNSPAEAILQALANEQSLLQNDVTQDLIRIESESPKHWPLTQAVNAMGRASARLQRNRLEDLTLSDAQLALDVLQSLQSANLPQEQTANANQTTSQEGDPEAESAKESALLAELRFIRDLQVVLHERLIEIDQKSANTKGVTMDDRIQSIAEQQALLATRMNELIRQVKE